MNITLTTAQVEILLAALNSHEGILSADYERSARTGSAAQTAMLSKSLADVRIVAGTLIETKNKADRAAAYQVVKMRDGKVVGRVGLPYTTEADAKEQVEQCYRADWQRTRQITPSTHYVVQPA